MITVGGYRYLKNKADFFLSFKIRYYICNSLKLTVVNRNILKRPCSGHLDPVAQQVEHIPFKDGVLGSNPNWITNEMMPPQGHFLFKVVAKLCLSMHKPLNFVHL